MPVYLPVCQLRVNSDIDAHILQQVYLRLQFYKEMKSVENPLALADGMKTTIFNIFPYFRYIAEV